MRFQPAHLQMRTRGGLKAAAGSEEGSMARRRRLGQGFAIDLLEPGKPQGEKKRACWAFAALSSCSSLPPGGGSRPASGLGRALEKRCKDWFPGRKPGRMAGWMDVDLDASGAAQLGCERGTCAETRGRPGPSSCCPVVPAHCSEVQSGPCSLWAFNPPTDRAACLMQRIRHRRWAVNPPHAPGQSVGQWSAEKSIG